MLLHFHCDALLLKCPLHQMHLQKIVGFRPPLEYLRAKNLMYAPDNNFEQPHHRSRRQTYNSNQRYGYYEPGAANKSGNEMFNRAVRPAATTSTICWRICTHDNDCIGYVHLLDSNECYGYTYFERNPNYLTIDAELPLVADAEAIFYEKTCLRVPESCKARLWTLTKIPGNSLVFQGKKTINTLITRRECAESCLFETEFQCLSASFAPSQRNNRERFKSSDNQAFPTLGRCILSDKDKMLQPDSFRAAPYDEEYIENQCYDREAENDNCSYELYANSSFSYAEAKYVGITQRECQSLCSHETTFFCQGVSYFYESNYQQAECLLHSEDIVSMGPRSLRMRQNSVYMRRVKCLDVKVLCSQNEMAIKYTPVDYFRGKMYVSHHSKDCVVQGNGSKSTLLRLKIGSEIVENRCGILRAYEVSKEYQRIFISALVVIQNNANVQTQGDRLIKVGCIMNNSTLNSNDDDNPYGSNEQDIPNAIALESSLSFTHHNLPSEGSLHFSIGNSELPIVPNIRLQVLDLSQHEQTNEVQIGQNLELQIIAEYTAEQRQMYATELPPLPDFRATSLIANSLDNQNSVLLIDDKGCPTDVTVFPSLQHRRTSTQNMLAARFHAFKFAGENELNFDVKIHYCTSERPCPPENCWKYGSSYTTRTDASRRSRRQANVDVQNFKIRNPVYISTVSDVGSQQLEEQQVSNSSSLAKDTVDLKYNLKVHGPEKTNSNSYMYGERGVLLIAAVDDQFNMDSICLNQSLLIALFIFWLIFQVALLFGCCYMLQKYKRIAADEERRRIQESLEYLEGRRVTWADQGGYTL